MACSTHTPADSRIRCYSGLLLVAHSLFPDGCRIEKVNSWALHLTRITFTCVTSFGKQCPADQPYLHDQAVRVKTQSLSWNSYVSIYKCNPASGTWQKRAVRRTGAFQCCVLVWLVTAHIPFSMIVLPPHIFQCAVNKRPRSDPISNPKWSI